MTDEQIVPPEVVRRARMHAALGDPVRLSIVDRLYLGDGSPGGLARTLRMPTNLLAHHLGVLEAGGVIRRVPSEGDRRRTYVQLRPDEGLNSIAGTPGGVRAPRVVFVCTHNSARSQLAAAAWSSVSSVPTTSAGTSPADRVHPRTVAIARRHGLELSPARTSNTSDVLRPDDLVVAVCDNAYEELRQPALHWAIPDPVRLGTDTAFEQAYAEITTRVERLAGATTTGARSQR